MCFTVAVRIPQKAIQASRCVTDMMLRTMDTHNIIIGCLYNAYYTYRPHTIFNFFTFNLYRYTYWDCSGSSNETDDLGRTTYPDYDFLFLSNFDFILLYNVLVPYRILNVAEAEVPKLCFPRTSYVCYYGSGTRYNT